MSRSRFGGRLCAVAAVAVALTLGACGSPGSSSQTTATGGPSATGSAAGAPIKVGIVTSLSGPLQSYGQIYLDAFRVGLDHATGGTGAVNGRPIEGATPLNAGDRIELGTSTVTFELE